MVVVCFLVALNCLQLILREILKAVIWERDCRRQFLLYKIQITTHKLFVFTPRIDCNKSPTNRRQILQLQLHIVYRCKKPWLCASLHKCSQSFLTPIKTPGPRTTIIMESTIMMWNYHNVHLKKIHQDWNSIHKRVDATSFHGYLVH